MGKKMADANDSMYEEMTPTFARVEKQLNVS
jgi:hypothetical protein